MSMGPCINRAIMQVNMHQVPPMSGGITIILYSIAIRTHFPTLLDTTTPPLA